MSVPRLKSIVIAALLLINALFITFIVIDKVQLSSRDERQLQQLRQLYSDSGLTLNAGGIDPSARLPSMAASRDTSAELLIAKELLGECRMTDQGGGIYMYESEAGTAVFRSGGELTVSLTGDGPGAESEKDIKRLLKGLGFQAAYTEELKNGFSACQAAGDAPVFNCIVNVGVEDGRLTSLSGRLATGVYQSDYGGELYSCVTALVRFLSAVNAGDISCNTVDSVSAGYILSASVFGDWSLEPVWRIQSDGGSFYISGISGTLIK